MVLHPLVWRGSDLQAGGWETEADGPSAPPLNLWSSLFSFKLHRWALELLPGPPFIISPGLVGTKGPLMMSLLLLICAAQSTREDVWLGEAVPHGAITCLQGSLSKTITHGFSSPLVKDECSHGAWDAVCVRKRSLSLDMPVPTGNIYVAIWFHKPSNRGKCMLKIPPPFQQYSVLFDFLLKRSLCYFQLVFAWFLWFRSIVIFCYLFLIRIVNPKISISSTISCHWQKYIII